MSATEFLVWIGYLLVGGSIAYGTCYVFAYLVTRHLSEVGIKDRGRRRNQQQRDDQ